MRLVLSDGGYEILKSIIDDVERTTASAMTGKILNEDAIKTIRAQTFRLRDTLNNEVELDLDDQKAV